MLQGIRVIELEGLGPAPFAGMMLADLGAEVIVVHRAVSPTRGAPPRNMLDRGKRSIVLDLKDARDLDVVRRLVDGADGLLEGFRPGTMEKLGLGPDDLRSRQPKLVYGRVTGWGQSGPEARCAGHDLNFIARSGALSRASAPDQQPLTPATLVGDIGGGALYLVAGMLAALVRAQRTGQGAVVDAAIVDGSAHAMTLMMAARAAGMLATERGNSELDGAPWSRCYQTADGRWLAVQCLEPGFYTTMLEILGLTDDERFTQHREPDQWPALTTQLSDLFASKTLEEWTALFAGSDACVAPVLSPDESRTDPHMASRKVWTEVDGALQARAAPRFDGAVPAQPNAAPERGEHTADIHAELGLR